MKPTLLLDAVLAAGIAALYVLVSRVVARRPASSADAAHARQAFVVWWVALAVVTAVGSVRHLLGAFGILERGVHAGLGYLAIPALVAALWGLLYYLVFIYTGKPRYRRPLLIGHVAFAAALFMLVVWMHPLRAVAEDWRVTMEYEHALQGPLLGVVLGLILVPVMLASAAYFTLFFRVQNRTPRFRIATVSLSFLGWFGSSALATLAGWTAWYWWPLAARAISLVATLLVLLAYHPPRALRAALRLDADEPRDPRGNAGDAQARPPEQALPARARHA